MIENSLVAQSSARADRTQTNGNCPAGRRADLPELPSAGQLHRYIAPVLHTATCLSVLERFFANPDLGAIPVVDACNTPFALIERHAFIEFFGRAFARELYSKKKLEQLTTLTTAIDFQPLRIEVDTNIDDVAQILIDAGLQRMTSGFIVIADGKYIGLANAHDLLHQITQRKQSELYYLAHYDPLTQIPNRMLLTDRLQQACRESARSGTLIGLLFVDLDRFKQVNDSMGHGFGDCLLRAVAERLQNCVRNCDTVARLGGDEFAILLDGIDDTHAANTLGQRVLNAMQAPFTVLERELFITASIGLALYPQDDNNCENLLAKADAAMYDAKSNGRNIFRQYEPGLSMYSVERLSLETDLRHALDNGELVLHYQPQICLASGSVVGVEALVRWQHPKRGLLPPIHFIGIAEESGLIVAIGYWVLREACRQQVAWVRQGLQPLRMSVNISAVQFQQSDFSARVQQVLLETGVDPGHVELELTESIVMHHAATVLGTLNALKDIGLQLAIDDFGTGFSSLSYLRRFPVDRLKIDQSFIRDIEKLPVNESIVRAIAALAKSLSLEIVAEGTETQSELTFVKACGCDEAQGYFYSRPLPPSELLNWLAIPRPDAN
ncbi:MAG TPA: EAL domain-containing protein [Spongiibacteraceae bacterium]|nr:EAL domain-containing protein [Spongiibacteraceae bacterium]